MERLRERTQHHPSVGIAEQGHHFPWITRVEGLRSMDTISPGWRDCGAWTPFPPGGGIAGEAHYFPRILQVEGLQRRDTISRTEGRDMVPTCNPETMKLHDPDPQSVHNDSLTEPLFGATCRP
ncbi:MAG: hypothetical protein R6U78_03295 [Bacteroidales bacterium]